MKFPAMSISSATGSDRNFRSIGYTIVAVLFGVVPSIAVCASTTGHWTDILDPSSISDTTGAIYGILHLNDPRSSDPEYLCAVPAMVSAQAAPEVFISSVVYSRCSKKLFKY